MDKIPVGRLPWALLNVLGNLTPGLGVLSTLDPVSSKADCIAS